MQLIELAAHLHDLGLNVFPVAITGNKKRPYLPSKENPYEWRVLKDQRLTKEQLLNELNLSLQNKKVTFLGILPGLIKEGKYKDNYFFAIDFDKKDCLDILKINKKICKEKHLWIEPSLSKGYHLYGITKDSMKWNKQIELGIELFSDDTYFIALYNNDGFEPYELMPGNLTKLYEDWCSELSKYRNIKVKTSSKIDIDKIRLGVNKSERNKSAFDYARILRDKGITIDEAMTIIVQWNKKNNPPTDEKELIETIKSVYSRKNIITIEKELVDEIKSHWSYFFDDDRFIACNLAELIAFKYTGENRGYLVLWTDNMKCDERRIMRYKDGVYELNSEAYIRGLVKLVLGGYHCRAKALEVVNCIKDDLRLRITVDDLVVNPRYLCLNNGVYDIETETLLDFSQDFKFTNKLNWNWNPSAKCPNIEKFLSGIVDKKDVALLEELFGWCLLRHYKYQYLVFLNGQGANGKGTYLNLMHFFLGTRNTTAITLHELILDKFARANMFQKNANIGDDIGMNEIKETNILKQLTGDGRLFMQKKGETGFDCKTYCKQIFACNILPKYPQDDTFSLWRRIIVIDFPNTFFNETDDKDILDKMFTDEEMSGLLNLALNGIKRLKENNKFSYTRTVKETKKIYKDLSEPASKFLLDNYEYVTDSSSRLYQQFIFDEYYKWCLENNIPMTSKLDFWQTFYETFPGMSKGRVSYSQDESQPFYIRCIVKRDKRKK